MKENFKLKNKLPPYTQVPNDLITGPLSPLAKAVYCYLASRPDEWKFWFNNIVETMHVGIGSVKKALTELANSGWVVRHQTRSGGRWGATTYEINYFSSASPWVENRATVAVPPLPCDGMRPTYKEGLKKRTKKKEIISSAGAGEEENLKFLDFKKQFIKKYSEKGPIMKYVGGFVQLEIRHGFLHNSISGKDLSGDEAVLVWHEMFEHVQNQKKELQNV